MLNTKFILLGLLIVGLIYPLLSISTVTVTHAATSTNSTVIFTVPGGNNNVSIGRVKNYIYGVTLTITEIAWLIFLVSYAVGWLIKGAPIPLYNFKEMGQNILYEALLAAFFLAIGSTIFYAISTVASSI